MSIDPHTCEGQTGFFGPGTKKLLSFALLCIALPAFIAWILCSLRIQHETQNILAQHRNIEQAWLDKSLESIRVWHNELLEQAHLVCVSEIFHHFVMNARALSRWEFETPPDPENSLSYDSSLRSMEEDLELMQNLLRDFTVRTDFISAHIVNTDGKILPAPEFGIHPSRDSLDLASEAAKSGRPIFGPVHHDGEGLVMALADPLPAAEGQPGSASRAALLLTVPMDKPLMTFLARQGEQSATILPGIVVPDGGVLYTIFSSADGIEMESVNNGLKNMEELPFGRRLALDGGKEVYSLAAMPSGLDWLFVIETPAAEIDQQIYALRVQIYGLGALASLAFALLGACFWALYRGRRHQAEAMKFEHLYRTINNQKMLLDSINASFQAGMALVDSQGRVQIFNPAFSEMCGKKIEKGTPLVKLLPDTLALKILEDISQVSSAGKSASDEIRIMEKNSAGKEEERLYRVTFYPCYPSDDGARKHADGCVAIFQDITEFRRKTLSERRKVEKERKKQEALIAAFARAVESVDPDLPGHSEKMAGVARLLGEELLLTSVEAETLDLAARLSQIGKIYVPRELLTRKGKLSPAELAELRKAPEYADKILRDLHFELPVRQTVAQIGEKFDGSGGPKGLKDKEISITGRALGIVNAFIAMTSPRAWRGDEGMSVPDAIYNLREDPGFDQEIVEALANIPLEKLINITAKK